MSYRLLWFDNGGSPPTIAYSPANILSASAPIQNLMNPLFVPHQFGRRKYSALTGGRTAWHNTLVRSILSLPQAIG
jgi:hypothetical protein